MYMDIDLNEDNYDYQELLDLFNLQSNFTYEDLKIAKKKVLMLHPDKSFLDKKYFIFFLKMYEKIKQIYALIQYYILQNFWKLLMFINLKKKIMILQLFLFLLRKYG